MTPERAQEIMIAHASGPYRDKSELVLWIRLRTALLAACAEERRDALTEAYNDALGLLLRCELPAAALALSLHMTKIGIEINEVNTR